ncbi:hypothetical protein DL98DRAFT_541961 [Cadophora sp. DSE1049]|nr:hypothetical protein DL98DRAFT_541961 [Cadophora sp. DSE1049]
MAIWSSVGYQWVISGSLIALQLTVDYVLYVETARFDAIIVVEFTVVDRTMLGLTSPILGFGIIVAAWRNDTATEQASQAAERVDQLSGGYILPLLRLSSWENTDPDLVLAPSDI